MVSVYSIVFQMSILFGQITYESSRPCDRDGCYYLLDKLEFDNIKAA